MLWSVSQIHIMNRLHRKLEINTSHSQCQVRILYRGFLMHGTHSSSDTNTGIALVCIVLRYVFVPLESPFVAAVTQCSRSDRVGVALRAVQK